MVSQSPSLKQIIPVPDHSFNEEMFPNIQPEPLLAFTTTKVVSKVKAFGKANFHLFKELVNANPWETVFYVTGAEECWQLLKDAFLQEQELWISKCKKSGKEDMRPT